MSARAKPASKRNMSPTTRPSRRAPKLRALPSCGSPPKTLEQLMKEQGIPDEPPDYVSLFTAVWPSKKDAVEFRRYIRSIRQGSKD